MISNSFPQRVAYLTFRGKLPVVFAKQSDIIKLRKETDDVVIATKLFVGLCSSRQRCLEQNGSDRRSASGQQFNRSLCSECAAQGQVCLCAIFYFPKKAQAIFRYRLACIFIMVKIQALLTRLPIPQFGIEIHRITGVFVCVAVPDLFSIYAAFKVFCEVV